MNRINSKSIGTILLVVSILLGITIGSLIKFNDEAQEKRCEEICGGHENESCPMEESIYEKLTYYFSTSFTIMTAVIGGYLIYSRPENLIIGEESKFETVLSVLNDSEREVLKAVKNQEGIKQSTLKYRVDFSKAKLSKLLRDLEERGLITREEKGKTYSIFLADSFE